MATEPRTIKGRATRDRIVEVAAEMLLERGPAEMRLDDVLERVGASKSQLYHYFEDKDDLVRAAVTSTVCTMLDVQEGLMAQLDSWEAIRTWMDRFVQHMRSGGGSGRCPLATLSTHFPEADSAVRKQLVEAFDAWEAFLARGLGAMQERGELDGNADPVRLTTATMSLLQGGLLLMNLRRDPEQFAVAMDAAYRLLRLHAVA